MPTKKRKPRRSATQVHKSKVARAKRASTTAERKMESLAHRVDTIESLKGQGSLGTYERKRKYNKLNDELSKASKDYVTKARAYAQVSRPRFRGK